MLCPCFIIYFIELSDSQKVKHKNCCYLLPCFIPSLVRGHNNKSLFENNLSRLFIKKNAKIMLKYIFITKKWGKNAILKAVYKS